jgi:hypothetical protein
VGEQEAEALLGLGTIRVLLPFLCSERASPNDRSGPPAAHVSNEDTIHSIRTLREDHRIDLWILFAGITHEQDVAFAETCQKRENLLKLESNTSGKAGGL